MRSHTLFQHKNADPWWTRVWKRLQMQKLATQVSMVSVYFLAKEDKLGLLTATSTEAKEFVWNSPEINPSIPALSDS